MTVLLSRPFLNVQVRLNGRLGEIARFFVILPVFCVFLDIERYLLFKLQAFLKINLREPGGTVWRQSVPPGLPSWDNLPAMNRPSEGLRALLGPGRRKRPFFHEHFEFCPFSPFFAEKVPVFRPFLYKIEPV